MTAREIAEVCDIPLSTTYRKLDLLTKASLLDERTEIRTDGHHTTRYIVAFEKVAIALSETRDFETDILRPPESPDERLAALWSAVRRET